MLNPATLDQRIRLETETRTADDYGGAAVAWTLLAEVWARVEPLTGKEGAEGARVTAPSLYRFTIRRRGDLTEAARIVWRGVAHNIRSLPDGGPRAETMAIEAERGVAT